MSAWLQEHPKDQPATGQRQFGIADVTNVKCVWHVQLEQMHKQFSEMQVSF